MAEAVDVAVYRDWQTEIIEDSENPAFKEARNLKRRVMIALSEREQHQYSKLRWLDRQLFIREKTLWILQRHQRWVNDLSDAQDVEDECHII